MSPVPPPYAGTDSEIDVIVNGQRFHLDYLPEAWRVFRYNDFEAGDRAVYTIGPFAYLPETIRFENRTTVTEDVIFKFFSDLSIGLEKTIYGIGDFLLSIFAGNADFVAAEKKVWSPMELAAVGPGGTPFSIDLKNGGEGHYVVHGIIRRIEQHRDESKFEISLTELECIRESEWDRGSDSDEPFVLALLQPIPGGIEKTIHGPYSEVDSGESRALGGAWRKMIPNQGGLILAVQLMEHDDESSGTRHRLLDEFAAEIERSTRANRQDLGDAIGASLSPDWKLEHLNVYAFTRGDQVSAGTVLDQHVNEWIDGNSHRTFTLGNQPRIWVNEFTRLEETFPVAFMVSLLTGF